MFRSFLAILLPCCLLAVGCGVSDPEVPLGADATSSHGHTDAAAGDAVASPLHSGQVVVSAKSTTEWVYFSLATGKVVDVADPAASDTWDLRFRRTQIGTNSGTSGMGKGGAVATGKHADAEVAECPQDGYQADAELPLPGPPGSGTFSGNPVLANWYDYDPATHATSSRGEVYCVRDAGGRYGSVRVVAYGSGEITVGFRHRADGDHRFQ